MELIEEFISTLEKRKYHRDEFYDTFLDFVDDKGISLNMEEESRLEKEAFALARENGLTGYDILLTLTDIDTFKEKLSAYVIKNGHYVFHFFNEKDDEKLLSFSEIWDKWKSHPPLGWIGSWCCCGDFFPVTLDMRSMDIENNTLHQYSDFKPIKFGVSDIKRIDFCSDNFIRFTLNDNTLIAGLPYKMDKSLIYNFMDNPLDILK